MHVSLGAKTISFPNPVWCIGSYDLSGKPNLMTVAWGGICNAKPPSVTISLRQVTYTYENIMTRKAFTVNIPSIRYVKEADYVGMVSGDSVDKFAATGLTPVSSEIVKAPYIKEFPLILECKVLQFNELGLHTQFVGEILDVKADAAVLDEKGNAQLTKVLPLIYGDGNSEYHTVGEKRFGKVFQIGKQLASKKQAAINLVL